MARPKKLDSVLVPVTSECVADERVRRNMREFVPLVWNIVDPDPFVPGWHIDAMCDHLQAVGRRQIGNLIINIPPRFSKSLIASVIFPAWRWNENPSERYLASSYAQALSVRDALKMRRLCTSPKYINWIRHKWDKFDLSGDQTAKQKWENTYKGYRLATSTGGMTTGEGGDIIIVDDPHNVVDGESEAERNSTLSWWDESMSTRLNNQASGRYVIIMQRVHESDLVGHILEEKREQGWTVLCLPLEYEAENRCHATLPLFRDPRTVEGESLNEGRFPQEAIAKLKGRMTEYSYAAQMQQRPSPRGGGMFPIDKFDPVRAVDESKLVAVVRYWDKAGSTGEASCRTAGVAIGKLRSGKFVVLDVVKGQWAASEREDRIERTTLSDKARWGNGIYSVWCEQEPGSGGKESAENTIRRLAPLGVPVYADRPTGDKVTRAEPFAAQAQGGNVHIVVAAWNVDYYSELEGFPFGRFRDQVDASSGAFNKVCGLGDGGPRRAGSF